MLLINEVSVVSLYIPSVWKVWLWIHTTGFLLLSCPASTRTCSTVEGSNIALFHYNCVKRNILSSYPSSPIYVDSCKQKICQCTMPTYASALEPHIKLTQLNWKLTFYLLFLMMCLSLSTFQENPCETPCAQMRSKSGRAAVVNYAIRGQSQESACFYELPLCCKHFMHLVINKNNGNKKENITNNITFVCFSISRNKCLEQVRRHIYSSNHFTLLRIVFYFIITSSHNPAYDQFISWNDQLDDFTFILGTTDRRLNTISVFDELGFIYGSL